jgi:hypothetical protein
LAESAYDTVISNVSACNIEALNKLEYERTTCSTLVENYAKVWASSEIKILESETVFELPIINPRTGRESKTLRQSGKRDRLGKLPDGRIALMETKTVSDDISPGSDYRNVLSINQQISMYFLARRHDGIEVETVIYDCIRKPTIRPSQQAVLDEEGLKIVTDENGERVYNKNGSPRQSAGNGYTMQTRDMQPHEWQEKLQADIDSRPEFYFQRFEVPRLESDIQEFQAELWDIAKDIHLCRKNNLYYRNTSACRNYNSLCPYYGFCSGELIIDPLPEGYRRADKVHEELE